MYSQVDCTPHSERVQGPTIDRIRRGRAERDEIGSPATLDSPRAGRQRRPREGMERREGTTQRRATGCEGRKSGPHERPWPLKGKKGPGAHLGGGTRGTSPPHAPSARRKGLSPFPAPSWAQIHMEFGIHSHETVRQPGTTSAGGPARASEWAPSQGRISSWGTPFPRPPSF